MTVSASEVYAKWRYRLIPDHILGEIAVGIPTSAASAETQESVAA